MLPVLDIWHLFEYMVANGTFSCVTLCDRCQLSVGTVGKEMTHACLQERNTLLVCCAEGQVLEIQGPEPDAHDHVHTYEITNLVTRTHQFKSVKSILLVRHPFIHLALKLDADAFHCRIISVK